MPRRDYSLLPYRPEVGCVLMVALMCLMCLMPYIFVSAMQTALLKLHLSPAAALPVIFGILLGGMVNLPMYRIERGVEQAAPRHMVYTGMGWIPVVHRQPTQTIVAINLGGCIIPVLLAGYELLFIASHSQWALWSLGIAVLINVVVCYTVARPIQGVGIAMPAFASPAVAIGVSWLLLMSDQFNDVRAPVAFIAGVSGPLIGADLLHLRHFTRVSAGVVSIGGAGTFDGIVVSSMLAALLA